MMTKLQRLLACLILILIATPAAAQIERVRAAQLQPDRCVDGQPRVVLVVDSVDSLTCDPASTGTSEALCCCLDSAWATCAPDVTVPDGDKGDITVSGSGATWSIDADTITDSELATNNGSSNGAVLRWTSFDGGNLTWSTAPLDDYYTLSVGAAMAGLGVPADSTTYYFGGHHASQWGTTADEVGVSIPFAGTIIGASIASHCTTAGSNTNWTLSIRLNNSSNTTIATVGAATNRRVWANQALNISVSAGDRIEITTTTPAWPANPAGCRFWGHVTVRR